MNLFRILLSYSLMQICIANISVSSNTNKMFTSVFTLSVFSAIFNILILSLSSVAIKRDYNGEPLKDLSVRTFFNVTLAFSVISLFFGIVSCLGPWHLKTHVRRNVIFKTFGIIGVIIHTFLFTWSVLGFVLSNLVGYSAVRDYIISVSVLQLILVMVSVTCSGLLLHRKYVTVPRTSDVAMRHQSSIV